MQQQNTFGTQQFQQPPASSISKRSIIFNRYARLEPISIKKSEFFCNSMSGSTSDRPYQP